MVLDLSSLPEADESDLDWDATADPAVVAEINDRAYEAPAGMFAAAITRFGEIDGLRLYQARIDGDPACVLATYDNEDDCELYMVATKAEHRGKGLARHLTHRAMLEARDRGLKISNLQATKLGYPVYARLGYKPICSLEMWERRK